MFYLSVSRKTDVFIKKSLIAIFSILFVFSGVMFTKRQSSRSLADSANNKYFTSIEVASGDTIWDIAEEYITDDYSSKQEYVDEVIKLNHLNADGSINAGCYIIVPYYSTRPMGGEL